MDDKYEVALCNIHSIKYSKKALLGFFCSSFQSFFFVEVSKGDNKFRTLNLKDSNLKSLGITDKLSLVEVHCIDFRVFIFDFKTASSVKDVEVSVKQ